GTTCGHFLNCERSGTPGYTIALIIIGCISLLCACIGCCARASRHRNPVTPLSQRTQTQNVGVMGVQVHSYQNMGFPTRPNPLLSSVHTIPNPMQSTPPPPAYTELPPPSYDLATSTEKNKV
ncbi:unnamed protein product, partial [Didymodactylos carnosus]